VVKLLHDMKYILKVMPILIVQFLAAMVPCGPWILVNTIYLYSNCNDFMLIGTLAVIKTMTGQNNISKALIRVLYL